MKNFLKRILICFVIGLGAGWFFTAEANIRATKDHYWHWLEVNQVKTIDTHCNDDIDRLFSYMYEISGRDKKMIGTRMAENDKCDPFYRAYNGTRSHDNGICQLNSRYHTFIRSEEYKNPIYQAEYCVDRWKQAKHEGRMPRYAYKVRSNKFHLFHYLGSKKGHE